MCYHLERGGNSILILGHAGITLGAAVLLNGAFSRSHSLPTRETKVKEYFQTSSELVPAQNCTSGSRASWLTSLANHIDIRLLLLGSLLPDIIDKPIGQFFFRETFNNGRIFCHTLLFLTLITLTGFYLYQNRSKTWLLVLSFGTGMHLVQDQMWLYPQTLFWPGYGFAFEKLDLTHWAQNILYALHTDLAVYVPELVGATILVTFVVTLVHKKRVYAFIRNGQV